MKKNNFWNRWDWLGLSIVFIVAVLIKLPHNSQGFFAFAYDQGRDLLAVARIIYEGHFTLIGPTTGLQGIFYGPWWYYFLSPLLYLSGGDPQKVSIFFAVLGIFTTLGIYFFIKYSTKSIPIAFGLSLIAAMSSTWMLGPTLIWSPSLVPPLMIIYFYILQKIFLNSRPIYYFLFGITAFLISEAGAAFGLMVVMFLFLTPLIFQKSFFKKEFLLTLLGGSLIVFPRFLFDLRHNFLISKSVFSYIKQANIYGEHLTYFQRFIQRSDLFLGFFSWSIVKGNKIIAIFIIVLIVVFLFYLYKNRKLFTKLANDKLLIYLLLFVSFLFLAFTIFKDRIWDHYLVGLPLIFVVIISRIMSFASQFKNAKIPLYTIIIFLVIFNFNTQLFSPFKINWLGGDADYINQKKVMDYISSKHLENYSVFKYSPAIFDYPFDYLFYWYERRGLLEIPKDNQRLIYLVIREESSKKYYKSGWYGDKTKDKTVVLERKKFPGDLVVEKHLKND